MQVEILKCHGSGNDFPLIDARAMTLTDAQWSIVARALADRSGLVGGDGLLLLDKRSEMDVLSMRMLNVDGSEAETCLNGLRCVARAGFEALDVSEATVGLKTSRAEVRLDPPLAPGVVTVRETVGPADLDVTRWPLGDATRIVEAVIPLLDSPRTFTAIAMPNPHLVSFVDHVDDDELSAIGARCEAAPPWLPNRANVSFIEQRGVDLFVRTFERGVGLTNSCGSAMAASTYAACLTGRIDYDRMLTVFNRGGMVRAMATPAGIVTLSGNATFEWRGTVTIDLATEKATDLIITERREHEVAAWDAVVTALAAG
ncbi:MAG: diaminopimelate epimerase [Sphingomonas sp.]|nr:diaminopimelate epimerase [Sphingomonas sp.]